MELKEYLNQNYTYKMTDLFILLQFHDEEKMERSRIIEKTGFPRETVQTCLTRMINDRILYREHPEDKRFLYKRTTQALTFTDKEYNIVNYMYRNHSNLLRPNSALLIFHLIEYDSYQIDKLIDEKKYKKDTVYKATAKLKDAHIIEKRGSGYYFTEHFMNKVLAYSQEPVTKTVLQLYRENYKTIMGLAASAGSYQKAIDSLVLVYNLSTSQAKELLELKVSDLVEVNEIDE